MKRQISGGGLFFFCHFICAYLPLFFSSSSSASLQLASIADHLLHPTVKMLIFLHGAHTHSSSSSRFFLSAFADLGHILWRRRLQSHDGFYLNSLLSKGIFSLQTSITQKRSVKTSAPSRSLVFLPSGRPTPPRQ